MGGLGSALTILGLVAFTAPASAHDNVVSAQANCATPLGSGYTVTWTIQNDFNVPETGTVTSVTGGLATLSSTSFSIPATPGQPATLTQELPATASGVITIDISSTWSDGFSTTDAGTFDLSQLNCSAPVTQTLSGHIYLCGNSNPTTTEVSGGTLAASGPTTVSATPNPLAPTQVGAGMYTVTATAPAGYTLVVCSGSSTPNSSGSTATQPVTVPSGGTGVGIFYVTPVTQTLSGHIYLCGNSNPTTTEVSGGTLAASGPTTVSATPNPLAPTQVGAGMYTVTATAPAGYTLVVCSGSSTPNSSGSTATQPVTVPSGGTGVGIFYVTPVTQTLSGHIYLCGNSNPTTTEVSGGTLAASGPTTVSATPNPLAPTQVGAGMYTVTATAPAGYTLVVCSGSSTPNSSGSTATQPVTVPSGGTGVGIFYVVASPPVAPSPTTAASTNPAAASPPSSPSTATPPTSASETPTSLAFTGAAISFEWLLALVMVLLGSLLVVLGRRRRGEGWLEVAQSLQRDEFAIAPPEDSKESGIAGSSPTWTSASSRRTPRAP